jgi:hypothetical protein
MEIEGEISIKAEYKIPLQRISDLLCSAFEGGSNYWYMIDHYEYPIGSCDKDFEFKYLEIPLVVGGSVIIGNSFKDKKYMNKVLNLKSINKGLKLLAKLYSNHFNDFITENDDAITSDVFLQLCLFGELVYG